LGKQPIKTARLAEPSLKWRRRLESNNGMDVPDPCESNPPFPEGDKRSFGYSRDKRSDCVQVVIALIVTPEGLPLAYEVMAGKPPTRAPSAISSKRLRNSTAGQTAYG
jgi:hypothetical protein